MKRTALIAALLGLATAPAFAAPPTFKLNLELKMGEDHQTTTTVMVRDGQKVVVSERRDEETNVRRVVSALVTSVPGSKNTVRIDFTIEDAHWKRSAVLAKPSMIVRLGEQATIEQSAFEPGKSLKLSVTARRRR